jgi:hypothetical protein
MELSKRIGGPDILTTQQWTAFNFILSYKDLMHWGRDSASEVDAGHLDAGTEGYQNEGDNEPTGLHVSAGKSSISEMVGTIQDPESRRVFFTQQHGLNRIFEVVFP